VVLILGGLHERHAVHDALPILISKFRSKVTPPQKIFKNSVPTAKKTTRFHDNDQLINAV
jgi:hypothetical protein